VAIFCAFHLVEYERDSLCDKPVNRARHKETISAGYAMPALSDTLLAGGCAKHIEAIHGEAIQVLSGLDAGKYFNAVREIESDQILTTDLGEDARAKIIIRFIDGTEPRLGLAGQIKTDDGKKWNAVRRQEANFLTQDFELTEIVDGKDS
jgi:hypothetical protein